MPKLALIVVIGVVVLLFLCYFFAKKFNEYIEKTCKHYERRKPDLQKALIDSYNRKMGNKR